MVAAMASNGRMQAVMMMMMNEVKFCGLSAAFPQRFETS
jgi:hypothetical protein